MPRQGGPWGQHGTISLNEVKPVLRRSLCCALLLSAVPAAAEVAPTPPAAEVKTDYIKRIVVRLPKAVACRAGRYSRRESCPPGVPSWALSRMHILVPDGTPKLVYRAPSADWCTPDF